MDGLFCFDLDGFRQRFFGYRHPQGKDPFFDAGFGFFHIQQLGQADHPAELASGPFLA